MIVNEIFSSIDGEGLRAGELCTFVRISGCNLRCVYCDTAYALGKEGTEMSVAEIVNKVLELGNINVTITGGEPLIHADVKQLVSELLNYRRHVNIETNGTVDPYNFFWEVISSRLFFTMDYKCLSSGMNAAMHKKNFLFLKGKDVVKCVVGSKEDFEDALAFYNSVYKNTSDNDKPWLYFSPVFGSIEPCKIVDFMKEHNLVNKVRVQVQLHKILWEPAMRGV